MRNSSLGTLNAKGLRRRVWDVARRTLHLRTARRIQWCSRCCWYASTSLRASRVERGSRSPEWSVCVGDWRWLDHMMCSCRRGSRGSVLCRRGFRCPTRCWRAFGCSAHCCRTFRRSMAGLRGFRRLCMLMRHPFRRHCMLMRSSLRRHCMLMRRSFRRPMSCRCASKRSKIRRSALCRHVVCQDVSRRSMTCRRSQRSEYHRGMLPVNCRRFPHTSGGFHQRSRRLIRTARRRNGGHQDNRSHDEHSPARRARHRRHVIASHHSVL